MRRDALRRAPATCAGQHFFTPAAASSSQYAATPTLRERCARTARCELARVLSDAPGAQHLLQLALRYPLLARPRAHRGVTGASLQSEACTRLMRVCCRRRAVHTCRLRKAWLVASRLRRTWLQRMMTRDLWR